MRYAILLTLIILGCKINAQNPASRENKHEVISDTTLLSGHPIKYYLNNDRIPQVCKDLYEGKRRPNDDSDILSLMDSLFTENVDTEPFYFLTLTRTMEQADGAYAEPLGMMAKSFVEKRTLNFIQHFLRETLLTKKDLDEWAKSVAGEIQISAEGREREDVLNVRNIMIRNCANCGGDEKILINEFIKLIESHCP